MISIVLGISKASARRGVLYHESNSTGAQDNLLQVKKNAGQRRIYRGIPVGISLLAFGLLLGALHAQGVESQAGAVAGANTPFVTLEAEAGKLGGGATIRAITPGMPVPNEATLELEASGHSLVELKNDGESVSWLNNTGVNANSIVIRASIPDAPTGGGITATIDLYVDGVFRQTIHSALDSRGPTRIQREPTSTIRLSVANPTSSTMRIGPGSLGSRSRQEAPSHFKWIRPILHLSTTSIALICRACRLR
jgi:hypothetical protein